MKITDRAQIIHQTKGQADCLSFVLRRMKENPESSRGIPSFPSAPPSLGRLLTTPTLRLKVVSKLETTETTGKDGIGMMRRRNIKKQQLLRGNKT
jgi:hypothetical protein